MLRWLKKQPDFECVGNTPHPPLNYGQIKRFIAEIPCGAEMHRRHFESAFQVAMDYSPESILDLEEIISRHFCKIPTQFDEIVHEFGCYLGQTIRRLHGGDWKYCTDCGWRIENVGGQDICIFPFEKVRRRFLLGKEESLSMYYTLIRSQIQNKSDDAEALVTTDKAS